MKFHLLFPLSISLLLCFWVNAQETTTVARLGAAATVHPLATQAALEAMQSGGNAVDGAIAAAVTLGVVDLHNSGIGGGIFMLIRKPDGTCVVLDGRETAPAAATKNMFLREGKAVPELSRVGALAVATPGWLAALDSAASQFGKHPLRRALRNAAQIAETGYQPDAGFAARVKEWKAGLAQFPAAAQMLQPNAEGRLQLPDLAKTYRHIADEGIQWFYQGLFAQQIGQWMQEHGGILSPADFAAYKLTTREPLRSTYRDYEIIGFPPPSSGGVHVAQILNILENFDMAQFPEGSPQFIHLVAEAMKLAFADRAHWLGDPDFAKVPRGLADKAYAKSLAAKINLQHPTKVEHGEPPAAQNDVFKKHTTHFSVADAAGWWVGCTATINYTYGSLVVVPGTGVFLNNEMDDFAAQPGAPNAFGLVGAEANAVAAGKRPLSSMSPTIVLKNGRPVLVLGAAGGPTIISQVVLDILRLVDFKQTGQAALAGPRFHQQWQPDELRVEETLPEEVRAALEKIGHRLKIVPRIGVSQIVEQTESGNFQGFADPRVGGQAKGF